MKTRLCLFVFALIALPIALLAEGRLLSGPMLGYQAKREVLIWLETEGANRVSLSYWLSSKPEDKKTFTKRRLRSTPIATQPMKFVLPLLEPGQTYGYEISIDDQPKTFPYPLTFKTQTLWEWRGGPPDFSFLFGSCSYQNETAHDRPGTPYGKGTGIFEHMADTGADLMIWGGDNLYLREVDFDSESGIWYRYSHDRAAPDLQRFFAAMPHYATWDDHDYGSNDSNKSFELKDITLKAFQTYWGNISWGEPDNPGVYGRFTYGDAAFFLMDDRYYRDDDDLLADDADGIKTQYGKRQREWLKQSLLATKRLKHFTFMFIVTGGQVITDFGGTSETFGMFPEEREEILDFIAANQITGVIFLSGDVHFTELARKKISPTQWVYELTSSPLTSGSWDVTKSERTKDPQRVPNTMTADQNFTHLAIAGPAGQRVVTITCIDKTGQQRWSHAIAESELR